MGCEYAERDDVIAEYVEGTLTGDAREAFEAHFFGCDRCFTQLQMTEKLIGAMEHHGEQIFADHREETGGLGAWAAPNRAVEKVNWLGRLPVIWHQRLHTAARFALAALLLLIVGSWFLKYFVFPVDYKQLASVQPSPWPSDVNTSDRKVNTLVEQAREQFNEKEYRDAKNTLTQAVGLDPTMASLKYLLGASCYLANDNENAIIHLKDALETDPQLYDARWYLAHAYLKNHEHPKAIDQLVMLVEDEESGYVKRAREILKEIDPLFFLGRGF
jgi:tetratricopeptide (TPR) repeat protein